MTCKNADHHFPVQADFESVSSQGHVTFSRCNNCLAAKVEMLTFAGNTKVIVSTKVVEPDQIIDGIQTPVAVK